MIKKIKLMFLSLSLATVLAIPMALMPITFALHPDDPGAGATPTAGTPTVSAQSLTPQDTKNALCAGSNLNPSDTTCPTSGGNDVTALIKKIINILSVLIGAIAVIMIIIGGFRYVTSGGKQESVTAAKNTILYAIVGLVIVALAQVIVHFVLNSATPG
ncbi:MAG TPA: pilin [Candidatus Babeliales bacterium]|nr:pilin [Candidatus Babeliales bacterium]